jgi:hypothetical protein
MQFEDVTADSGLGGTNYAFAGSVADFDNDGRPDLLVSHLRGVTLYRNREKQVSLRTLRSGQGLTITTAVGLGAWSTSTTMATWICMSPTMFSGIRRGSPNAGVAGRIDFCHPRY